MAANRALPQAEADSQDRGWVRFFFFFWATCLHLPACRGAIFLGERRSIIFNLEGAREIDLSLPLFLFGV